MRVVFRVDSSVEIGFGHLSRCINLAEELRMRGSDVTFVCRDLDDAGISSLEEKLFRTVLLPRSVDVILQSVDASEFIASLVGVCPDWVILDSYSLDSEWETAVRPFVEKIAVIEDLADRRHDCDLLIDQNYSDRTAETFKLKERDTCKFLIGPKYALLASVFAKIREVSVAPRTELKRIFVFCGGSDPNNLTKTVLDALGGDEFSEIKVDVVIGSQNQNFNSELTNPYKSNIEFHESGDNFAKIMSSADLAIGAGGTTTWERMCLGLPSIVVSIADNQVPACEKLGLEGLVRYLGPQPEVTTELVTGAVSEFLQTPSALSAVSVKSQIFVDGKGCERVAEVMCPSGESDLKVRLAKSDDCVQFFNWANDPVVREQSLNTVVIQWMDHQKWFGEKIKSDSTEIYVLEASGLPVGQVRFEKLGSVVEINYSLDDLVRGRGWASLMLEMAMEKYLERDAVPLKAIVKSENKISQSIFFKIGFSEDLSANPPPSAMFTFAFASDRGSWFNAYLRELKFYLLMSGHSVSHVHDEKDLSSADFCFYLSFSRVVSKATLDLFRHNFVVHSSDLPEGRGWSPLTWQILEGKSEIQTVLFEASEKVDSGQIYLKQELKFAGHELIDEIRATQGTLIVSMVKSLIEGYPESLFNGIEQSGKGSYYPRRRPGDSKVDPNFSLRQVFLQLRVADNVNYPVFFELNGHKYELRISKK